MLASTIASTDVHDDYQWNCSSQSMQPVRPGIQEAVEVHNPQLLEDEKETPSFCLTRARRYRQLKDRA